MSRIGKQPVVVPSGVTVTVGNDNLLTVKGPKGELRQAIDRDIKVEIKDGQEQAPACGAIDNLAILIPLSTNRN